jgi:hypothetical protein
MAIGVQQISTPTWEFLYHRREEEAPMRKLFCSTVLALVSFVPGAQAGTIAPIQTAPLGLIIPMPEPSSPALLAVDVLSVGVLAFLLRRRKSSTNQ